LCDAFNILNLHPALPWGPKGTWRQVTKQVVDEGIKATGTMMHLVIEELDAGPAVTYSEVDVEGCDFAEVRKRQFEQEEPLMLATLEGYAKGRFRIGDKAVNLTLEVEALIREKHENERL